MLKGNLKYFFLKYTTVFVNLRIKKKIYGWKMFCKKFTNLKFVHWRYDNQLHFFFFSNMTTNYFNKQIVFNALLEKYKWWCWWNGYLYTESGPGVDQGIGHQQCPLLHCIVLCCVLYCTVLYCTVLYCTVLYSTLLFSTVV